MGKATGQQLLKLFKWAGRTTEPLKNGIFLDHTAFYLIKYLFLPALEQNTTFDPCFTVKEKQY